MPSGALFVINNRPNFPVLFVRTSNVFALTHASSGLIVPGENMDSSDNSHLSRLYRPA